MNQSKQHIQTTKQTTYVLSLNPSLYFDGTSDHAKPSGNYYLELKTRNKITGVTVVHQSSETYKSYDEANGAYREAKTALNSLAIMVEGPK